VTLFLRDSPREAEWGSSFPWQRHPRFRRTSLSGIDRLFLWEVYFGRIRPPRRPFFPLRRGFPFFLSGKYFSPHAMWEGVGPPNSPLLSFFFCSRVRRRRNTSCGGPHHHPPTQKPFSRKRGSVLPLYPYNNALIFFFSSPISLTPFFVRE